MIYSLLWNQPSMYPAQRTYSLRYANAVVRKGASASLRSAALGLPLFYSDSPNDNWGDEEEEGGEGDVGQGDEEEGGEGDVGQGDKEEGGEGDVGQGDKEEGGEGDVGQGDKEEGGEGDVGQGDEEDADKLESVAEIHEEVYIGGLH